MIISTYGLKLNNLFKVSILSFIFCLIYLFFNIPFTFALYNQATGECEGGPSTEYLSASVCEENGEGPPPAPQCNRGSPDWTFFYPVCRVDTIQVSPTISECDYTYTYVTSSCSATDTCRQEPYLYPGICSISSYNPSLGPESACVIGGRYKTCCNSDGTIDGQCFGGNYSGSCPVGTLSVICGVSQPDCDAIEASYPGTYCTTQACGAQACTILGSPASAPTLTSFGGSCSGSTYIANLSWTCDSADNCNPLPSTDSGCPNGYWVDISTSSSFSSYSNKCVTSTSTNAPASFSPSFTFDGGTTYYARVFNGSHSNTQQLTASTCGPSFSYNTSCTNLGVQKGSSGNSTVSLSLASGTSQSVGSFSVSGLPSGASASFSPTSCTPNCSTTMTISATSSAPTGNYSISVNGSPAATTTNSCTLTISDNPPPTVDIKANNSDGPISIAHNTSATLSWTTTNSPTSCTASGAWSGSKSISGGSQSSGTLTGPNTFTYNIACSNANGTSSDSVTVNVNAPPVSNCDITSITPNPVTWNSISSSFNFTQINWTTSGKGGSNLYYYNPGICSLASCPVTGWSLITSASYDASFGHVWNPNPFGPAQGSIHTIGLTGADNVLCDTYNISFGSASSTPGPTSTPAPTSRPPENPDYVYVTVRVVEDNNPQPNPYPKCNYPAGGCTGDPARGAVSNQCLVVPDQTGEDICDDDGCQFDAFARCAISSNYPVICNNAANNQSCFYADLPVPSNKGVAGVSVGGSCQYWDGSSGGVTSGVTDTSGWANISIYRPWRYVPADKPLVTCNLYIKSLPAGYSANYSACQYDNRYHKDSWGFTQSPNQRLVNIGSSSCGPLKSYIYNGDEFDEFYFVSPAAIFTLKSIPTPWIKTTSGDVHSNTRINTPGGP